MEKSYKLFCSQVSGKQPKLLSQDQLTILKGYNPHQQAFYQHIASLPITSPSHSIQSCIPKFRGTVYMDRIPIIHHNQKVTDDNTLEWLEHLRKRYEIRNPDNKFLVLENLVHSYKKANVLDVKLGIRELKKLKPKKNEFKQFFVLNGCRINVKHFEAQNDENYETLFFSKYFHKTLKTDEQILEHLALYFFDGEKLRNELLDKVIYKLREITLASKTLRGWKFYSTSLCIFHDAEDDTKFDVKLIDFGRSFYTGLDLLQQAPIKGLQNFHRLLMQIKTQSSQLQQKLTQMKQKYLKQAVLIVPDNKIMEYEVASSKEVSETHSPKKQVFQECDGGEVRVGSFGSCKEIGKFQEF